MTEELVTLETAKLLKEKEFDEYCKEVINKMFCLKKLRRNKIWK